MNSELTQEVYLEQQILTSVENMSKELGGMRGQVRDLRTALLGTGEQGESPFGRLPMVERDVADHNRRIGLIEIQNAQFQSIRSNATGVGRWLFGIIGAIIGGVIVGVVTLLATKAILGH